MKLSQVLEGKLKAPFQGQARVPGRFEGVLARLFESTGPVRTATRGPASAGVTVQTPVPAGDKTHSVSGAGQHDGATSAVGHLAWASGPGGGTRAPAGTVSPAGQGTPGMPQGGLIKVKLAEPGGTTSGLWWDPETNTYWTGDCTTGQWYNLVQAPDRPQTVQVAPHIEMPFNIYAAKTYWPGAVKKTAPGAGAFIGGQFVKAKSADQARRIWQNQASDAERAFMQMLPSVLPGPLFQKHAASYTNPRDYFRDTEVYMAMLQERGVPQTPEEALAFWQEYQWRVYAEKVRFAQAVGLDPGIYPPPDRWPDVLDQAGKPHDPTQSGPPS